MTRFEEASMNSLNMSVMVAFCIAGYLEQIDVIHFSTDELTQFLHETSTDIEKWLKEESQTQGDIGENERE